MKYVVSFVVSTVALLRIEVVWYMTLVNGLAFPDVSLEHAGSANPLGAYPRRPVS